MSCCIASHSLLVFHLLRGAVLHHLYKQTYELGKLNLEDESFKKCIELFFGQYSISKIKQDIKTIEGYSEDMQILINAINMLVKPSSDWILSKLETLEEIAEIEMVTKNNDVNGLLGKEGGYIGCLYFSKGSIEQEDIPGDTILEKGTDCGGSIEIYRTLEDAKARCEYLAGFDGTILYSGSYAILGTMVIRTSYLLSDEQQFELTNNITKALTVIE